MSKSKTITVTFTKKQAEALLHAIGNSLYSEEDAMAIFNDKKASIEAAWRGVDKINEALRDSDET